MVFHLPQINNQQSQHGSFCYPTSQSAAQASSFGYPLLLIQVLNRETTDSNKPTLHDPVHPLLHLDNQAAKNSLKRQHEQAQRRLLRSTRANAQQQYL
jgi:hypothetical protein